MYREGLWLFKFLQVELNKTLREELKDKFDLVLNQLLNSIILILVMNTTFTLTGGYNLDFMIKFELEMGYNSSEVIRVRNYKLQ